MWATSLVGTPTVARDPAAHVANCALTSASEAQSAVLYQGDTRVWSLDRGCVVDMRVKLKVLPTLAAKLVWGLVGALEDDPDVIAHSVFFAATGSGQVRCEMDDDVTDRSALSGVTVLADEYHQFRIDASNKADVKFFIDGVPVATATTFNFAAVTTLQLYFAAYKASGGGVGTLTVDAVRAWMVSR
jgi:hypothetical protein